ncbi:MAG TPA: flagellar hook capping FlgD N-terminal domain-containing protein [Steroidobacteraceae bacterium]|jgi:flagellar basal-body rod modification protein FlgD|nr:flagellar hook capping FlgD N-terminal domain-containing protein [Steroidobacteraceae bacterium]
MSTSANSIASLLNSTATTAAATGPSSTAIPANMQINETDFLQLISTQLQNQDPLQPTDPSQFLGQLEGLSEVSSLQSMQSAMSAQQVTSGASLLGQSVLAPGTTANLASGGSIAGAVNAPAGTTALMVSIANSSGTPVTSFQVTPAGSGMTTFSWNGATSSGTTAPAGQYTVSVNATVNGASQSVAPMVVTQVQSVTIDPTTQQLDLNTNGGTVPLSSVVTIL